MSDIKRRVARLEDQAGQAGESKVFFVYHNEDGTVTGSGGETYPDPEAWRAAVRPAENDIVIAYVCDWRGSHETAG